MEPDRFDDLTRWLAAGASRRRILTGLGGAFGAALVAATRGVTSAAPGGNSACDAFCHTVFGDTRAAGQCTRDAAHGNPNGLCAQCGADPANYCDGTCTDISSDPNNCGGCGNVCATSVANATGICSGGGCTSDYTCSAGYYPGGDPGVANCCAIETYDSPVCFYLSCVDDNTCCWTNFGGYNRAQCQAVDTCAENAGHVQGGGGCYKWAYSSDTAIQPIDGRWS